MSVKVNRSPVCHIMANVMLNYLIVMRVLKCIILQADSGGPLMSSDGSNSMVIGVVSTGIGCGRPRLPGLYTRISEYMDWVQEIVRLN